MARLLKRQNPWLPCGSLVQVTTPVGPAWCPGGRTAQKALRACASQHTHPARHWPQACMQPAGQIWEPACTADNASNTLRTAQYLAVQDLIHSPNDGTSSRQCSSEAAAGDGRVTVQMADGVVSQCSTHALQLPHIRPLVHAQHVRNAGMRGLCFPVQSLELGTPQDPQLWPAQCLTYQQTIADPTPSRTCQIQIRPVCGGHGVLSAGCLVCKDHAWIGQDAQAVHIFRRGCSAAAHERQWAGMMQVALLWSHQQSCARFSLYPIAAPHGVIQQSIRKCLPKP
jgi:hypothetical protein